MTRSAPKFADPTLRFYPLWSINAPLNRDRLHRQVAQFKEDGMDGIVLHPRFYPEAPPYMSAEYLQEVSACILEAKRQGLAFWIYDENGWPSGKGNGEVVAKYPDSHSMRLELTTEAEEGTMGSFYTDKKNRIVSEDTPGARQYFITRRKNMGVNPLESEVMEHFLELILERYRTGLDAEAWDYVEAIFFDEPESGMVKGPRPEIAGVSWSDSFPELLRERMGSDFESKLPLLFAQAEGYKEARATFWELVCDRFIEGYLKPYHAWCQRHGKWFVGHIKGEESPLFQVPMIGSNHRILRHASMPGIDALERYPMNNFFPRQASSVSRQFGPGGCSMVEGFGGAGWGASPEDLERYTLWLARAGLTEMVFHLCHYRLDSNGISDWPPSFPRHMNWRRAFPEVIRRVRQKMTDRPSPVSDTLVVVPARGLMQEFEPWELLRTNLHNGVSDLDTPANRMNQAFLELVEQLDAAGVAYDFTDERTLEEEGSFADGRYRLGQMEYEQLLVPPSAVLRAPAADWPAHHSLDSLPKRRTTRKEAESASQKELEVNWSLVEQPENAWLLDTKTAGDLLVHRAQFDTALGADCPALSLWFADHAVEASLDGLPLELKHQDEGSRAKLPSIADGKHDLCFRLKRPLRVNGKGRFRPYVWLEGAFLVVSDSDYEEGPHGTICTEGPLVAKAGCLSEKHELVGAGYAFGYEPVVAETELEFSGPVTALEFSGVEGDAIRLRVDGEERGWAWGPEWRVDLAKPLTAGTHRLRVELIPSTFNRYGPHHYFNGDWKIVTPGQAIGFRNAVDPADAPEQTHVPAWHFKPLRLPRRVGLATGERN